MMVFVGMEGFTACVKSAVILSDNAVAHVAVTGASAKAMEMTKAVRMIYATRE